MLLELLKSSAVLAGEIVLFALLTTVIGGLLSFGVMNYLPDSSHFEPGSLDNPMMELLTSYLPMIIGSLAALWLCHVVLFKRAWNLTGVVSKGLFKDTMIGALLGFVLISTGFLILWIGQGLEIVKVEFVSQLFFGFLLLFIVQSAFEEIATRSFLIPTIERRFGVWFAIILSSILFSILHGSNPNITIIALANIFLAGFLLGMLFVRYRSVWPAIGLHAAWNFLQGSFYGFEVSGFDVYSWIDTKETGIDWITGGEFGYEGSILALLSLAIACFIIWRQNPEAFATLAIYKMPKTNELSDNLIDAGAEER